jgi:Leucine-rich repeat (LRR) protein
MRKFFSALLLFLLACGVVSAQNEQTPYEIALQRIEEARVSGATELDLGSFGLSTLPPEIGVLENLLGLHLWNNRLTTVPPEVGNLSNLVWLNLGNNQITHLPPEIGNLQNLQLLELHNNQLSNLPTEISHLQKLCYLGIRENEFYQLPIFLYELQQLETANACYSDAPTGIHLDNNPLISPPPKVVSLGTAAILEYLRNEAWWHLQRLIAGGASFAGILAAAILGLLWKSRRGKGKKKNEGQISS